MENPKMSIDIKITETHIKRILKNFLTNKLNMDVDENDIKIEVKSKQNYKSEWEMANFRAIFKKDC